MVRSIVRDASKSVGSIGRKGRVVDWNSYRESHLGQWSNKPHRQAGHMDASDPIKPQ
jgi:hypothetical protein